MYVASSTRAAGTAGTSDSDTCRVSRAAHVAGTCRPCVVYPTTRGCVRGDCCAFCHFNHPIAVLERRVRKRTRDKIKLKLSKILKPQVDLATWLIVDTFSRSSSAIFFSLHYLVLLLLHDIPVGCSQIRWVGLSPKTNIIVFDFFYPTIFFHIWNFLIFPWAP